MWFCGISCCRKCHLVNRMSSRNGAGYFVPAHSCHELFSRGVAGGSEVEMPTFSTAFFGQHLRRVTHTSMKSHILHSYASCVCSLPIVEKVGLEPPSLPPATTGTAVRTAVILKQITVCTLCSLWGPKRCKHSTSIFFLASPSSRIHQPYSTVVDTHMRTVYVRPSRPWCRLGT